MFRNKAIHCHLTTALIVAFSLQGCVGSQSARELAKTTKENVEAVQKHLVQFDKAAKEISGLLAEDIVRTDSEAAAWKESILEQERLIQLRGEAKKAKLYKELVKFSDDLAAVRKVTRTPQAERQKAILDQLGATTAAPAKLKTTADKLTLLSASESSFTNRAAFVAGYLKTVAKEVSEKAGKGGN